MRELNSIITKVENFITELSKMKPNSHSCNHLYDYVKEVVSYIESSEVESNTYADSCQNQLLDSISGISPNAKYGLNSKKSISLFNRTQSEVHWFLKNYLTHLKVINSNTNTK